MCSLSMSMLALKWEQIPIRSCLFWYHCLQKSQLCIFFIYQANFFMKRILFFLVSSFVSLSSVFAPFSVPSVPGEGTGSLIPWAVDLPESLPEWHTSDQESHTALVLWISPAQPFLSPALLKAFLSYRTDVRDLCHTLKFLCQAPLVPAGHLLELR